MLLSIHAVINITIIMLKVYWMRPEDKIDRRTVCEYFQSTKEGDFWHAVPVVINYFNISVVCFHSSNTKQIGSIETS